MKKIVVIIFAILVLGVFFYNPIKERNLTIAWAEENNSNDYTTTIKETIDELDLDELEEFCLGTGISEMFENKPIKDVIYELISGQEKIDITLILNLVSLAIKGNLSSAIKLMVSIILIVAVAALSNASGDKSRTKTIVNYFVMVLLLSVVASLLASSLSETIDVITKIKTLMELLSPVLLALLVAVGGVSSSAIYQPALVVLTGGVIKIISSVLVTIITLYFILAVLSGLNSSIKLDKFKGFLSSTFKWIVGLVFTIFIGYLSLSGITASGKDGISIKTAKFALKSYLPLVGGYVSDSYEIFRAGSVLIKNALGTIGAIILFALIIFKVLNLVIYNLAFKLASGITEPFASKEISSFLSSLSVVFSYLIAAIVMVFMMCFITLIIIISTANAV